jgi:hypothetical protein
VAAGTATFAQIATFVAVNAAVAVGTSAASNALAPKPKVGSGGSPVDFRANPDAPVPFLMGHMATTGTQVHANVGGDKNKYLSFYTVLSAGGPIHQILGFTANDTAVSFTADAGEGASGYYLNRMWQKQALGQPTGEWLRHTATGSKDTPANHGGNPAEWTASHSLKGLAATLWTLESDSAKYSTGVPKPLWECLGLKVWDPAQDSTYPGGVGAHRRDDWRTWEYTDNPYLHALAWVRGHRVRNADGTLGRRIAGIGAPDAQIDIAAFVEGRGVAYTNAWGCNGVVTTSDDKWHALAAILQAGGGVPLNRGAQISCMINAPRASVLTITGDDLVGEAQIDASLSFRDRINTVIPKFRSSAHGWQVIAGLVVTAATYVSEDKDEARTREIEYPYVTSSVQAAQLAAYDLTNSREALTGTLPCKPHLLGLRAGDAFTVNEPELGLNGRKCVVVRRSFDPASGVVTISFRSETDGKHDFALGRTDVAPATPALTGIDPAYVAAPGAGSWQAAQDAVTGAGGAQVPVIRVTGETDNPGATEVLIGYRLVDGSNNPLGDWVWRPSPNSSVQVDLRGLTPGLRYEVAVRYRVRGVDDPSVYTSLGLYVVPNLISNAAGALVDQNGALRTYEEIIADPGGDFDTTPPGQVTGLVVTSSIRGDAALLSASWTARTETDLGGYQIGLTQSGGGEIIFPVISNNYQIEVPANVSFSVRVRAVDKFGSLGAWSSTVVHLTTKDTVAPAAPTGLLVSASLTAVFLSWTNPVAADLAHVEVWENTANNSGAAIRIATVNAQSGVLGGFARSGLSAGETRWYWLKAVDRSGNTSGFSSGSSATIAGLTDADISAISAAKLTGQITSTQISDGAVSTPKLEAGAVSAAKIAAGAVTTEKLSASAVTAEKIAAGTITADKIQSGTITGDKISTTTSLPGSITVGNTGVTLQAAATANADPAAAINANTTQIDPGKVTISGGTTLANWRNGGDTTKIEGGSIAANTISANRLTIGQRGINVLNIQFEHNTPNPNCLAWTAGTIIYTNNAGVETFVNTIAGGGANVFYAGQPVYIFWLQGEGFLRATNDLAAATGPNSVCLATYTGGSSLYSTYGRTVIDGDQIKTGAVTAAKIAAGAISANKIVTGAITADKVAAGAITADKISVTSLSAISANFGTITVQRLNLPGGVIDTGRLAPGAVTGDIYYNNYQFPQDIPQAGVTTPPVVTSPPPPPPPGSGDYFRDY